MHPSTPTALAEKVEARVNEAIADFGADPAWINRAASLQALDIDSLDLVELTQMLDDEFDVAIGAKDAQRLETVGDIIELVLARLS